MPPPSRCPLALVLLAWAGAALPPGLPPLGAAEQPAAVALLDQRVLVLGDSITQAGTYVSMALYTLLRAYPTHRVDIVSIGLSSETTSGLTERIHPGPRPCVLSRLGRALAGVKPQLVVACYGMNDGIYLPLAPARAEAFHAGLLSLVRQCRAAGAQVILLTPPVFDPVPHGDNLSQDDSGPGYTRPYARYDEVLAAYGDWEMGLHLEGVTVIDLHHAMGDYLAGRRRSAPGFILSGDSVHPNDLGHLLMARTLCRGAGVTVLGDDLEAELARITGDPLYQKAKQLRELRSGPWLAYSRGTMELDALTAVEQQVAERMVAIDMERMAGLPEPIDIKK
jgi:lysophospholipase L1-like esterase